MRSFLYKQRKLLALLIPLALWLSLFSIWVQWVTAAPFNEVITLAPRGSLSKEIQIVIPEEYELNLVFKHENVPLKQMQALLGNWAYKDGMPIPSGIRVPVKWTLISLPQGSIVASGEVDSFGSRAWSASEAYRLVDYVRVLPGRYLFNAEILRDVPEFAHIKTRLTIQLDPKGGSTWQIAVVWFGSIANIFIFGPATMMLFLVLSWRAVLAFRSRGRYIRGTILRS